MNEILQVYGKNTGAQTIVQEEVTAAFPALETQFSIVETIRTKYYDWLFPFVYTADGGADMAWRASVKAWIARNSKLVALESLFEQGSTDGTFTDTETEEGNETFTDNHATEQETTFKGVDTTASGALADKIVTSPVTGQNTTERENGRTLTRKYADGRNWVRVMNDITKAEEPVYSFINAFARLLVSPDWCKIPCSDILPPSMEMSVEAETLSPGAQATAEIVNRATPFNADWLLSLGIPAGIPGDPGDKGDTGDTGAPALTYNNMYFSDTVPSESLVIIQELEKFNRTPVVGDMCNFVVYYTGSSPDTRPVYIVIGRCTLVDSSYATFETVNFAVIGGEKGEQGDPGPQGDPGEKALQYNDIWAASVYPYSGNIPILKTEKFSRPPKSGEYFILFFTAPTNRSGFCITQATGGSDRYRVTSTIVETTGAPGEAGAQSYLHNIYFEYNDVGSGEHLSCALQIKTDDNTPWTVSNFLSNLENYLMRTNTAIPVSGYRTMPSVSEVSFLLFFKYAGASYPTLYYSTGTDVSYGSYSNQSYYSIFTDLVK